MARFWISALALSLSHGLTLGAWGAFDEPAQLGAALFHDVNLSLTRTQSCATCHSPDRAFTDGRTDTAGGAVSAGHDGTSTGTRNTPTLTYVALTPELSTGRDGSLRGGFFYDGRAPGLADQAVEPIFNALEMGLVDEAMLRDRIRENDQYVSALQAIFGEDVLEKPGELTRAVGLSIADFERSQAFMSYDSKFDRWLKGEATLTTLEDRGRLLFFSSVVNCSNCHLLKETADEVFTDYTFHNIGVPRNPGLDGDVDPGLAANPAAHPDRDLGKFKVPTLRNIAVTGPYMHNGVFRDLRTVLIFYNKFTMQTPINPETNEPWGDPEVSGNISDNLLRSGQPLSESHLAALTAFLRALTDARYEHLLE